MIDAISIIKIAIRALKANKMRSALTSLGLIIGVSTVIIMLAIGTGAKEEINKKLSSLGSNVIIVRSGASKPGGVRRGAGSIPTLKYSDATAIREKCKNTVKVTSAVYNGSAQVVYGNSNWATRIEGVDEYYLTIENQRTTLGSSLTASHVKESAKVCVLGQTVVTALFGDVNPIGKIIRLNAIPFKVIGILDIKGQSMRGHDQDDKILVPVTTAQKKLFGAQFPGMVESIYVQGKTKESLDMAIQEIKILLRQRHKIKIGQDDDFTVRNLAQLVDMVEESTNVMRILLASIASVSMLVGGIGIMNIMLVSVTERTREIGIRLAIGAKIQDVRLQFLTESLLLSVLGGGVGIIIGIVGAYVVGYFTEWAIKVSIMSVVFSFGFAALIGIIFGFYPAYKASKLHPIAALRYE